MWEQLAIGQPETAKTSVPAAPKVRFWIPSDQRQTVESDKPLYIQFKVELPNIILGVALAGGSCPILMWVVFAVIGFVQAFRSTASPDEVFLAVMISVIVCAIGAVAAFIHATFVFVAVYWVLYWFVRSLQMRGEIIWLAAFSGGLAGFVAVLPVFLLVLNSAHQGAEPYWGLVLAMVMMAGPTTVMGQIGGAWGVWRGWSYERAVAAPAVVDNVETTNIETERSTVDPPEDSKWIQFRIWHLLVLSFWVSVLLSAIRLCGIDVVAGIVLLVGWAAGQAVSLLLGGLVVRWWHRWKARRQTRST